MIGNISTSDHRRSVKVSESVMVRVAQDIITERLTAGDRLPNESQMMQRYGVSRASLREAMRLLEVQGLITLKPGPGGGAFVGAVDHRNLARTLALFLHMAGMTYRDVMGSQVLLESLVASSAADNPDREKRTAMLRAFIEPEWSPDDDGYRDLAHGFHATAARLALNRTIALLGRAVSHVVTVHVTSHMDFADLRPTIVTEHSSIARAIVEGDSERARVEMADHFRAQHAYFDERWPERLDDIVEHP